MGSQAFMDPCSPLTLTPEGSFNSVSTGPLALTPSPLPARLPVLDQSAELDRTRYLLQLLPCAQSPLCCLCTESKHCQLHVPCRLMHACIGWDGTPTLTLFPARQTPVKHALESKSKHTYCQGTQCMKCTFQPYYVQSLTSRQHGICSAHALMIMQGEQA